MLGELKKVVAYHEWHVRRIEVYLAKEVISPEALIDAKKAFAEARKRLKAANDQLKRAPKDGSNRPQG